MADVTKTGIVTVVSDNDWTNPDTGEELVLWSFQIDGDKRWFRTGENDPMLEEGDAIRFVFATRGMRVDIDSIVEIDPSEVEEDAPPKRRSGGRSSKRSTSRGSTGRSGRTSTKSTATKSGGASGKSKENWDARAKYWENKEKRDIEVVEPRITFSAAQRDAVSVVTAAMNNDALSFGNAAKGKRLDMLLDMVDQVAYRFYDQRINGEYTEDVVRTTQEEVSGEYGEE